MDKIRRMANIALLIIFPFLFYYPYKVLSWQLDMAFLKPEQWLSSGWVEAGAVISPLTRVVYFSIWVSALIAGMCALFCALRIIWFFREGIVFEDRVARAIGWLGRCTVASSSIHIFAACLSPMIVSWHNPSGPLPLRLWLSTSHLSLMLCGLAFMLMGYVLREGIKVARENESFV